MGFVCKVNGLYHKSCRLFEQQVSLRVGALVFLALVNGLLIWHLVFILVDKVDVAYTGRIKQATSYCNGMFKSNYAART